MLNNIDFMDAVYGCKKGDFYCTLKLIIPSSLSRKQRKILEELEDTDLEDEAVFRKFDKINR